MRNAWNGVIAEIVGTFLFFFVGIGAIGAMQFVNAGNPVDPASALIVAALAHGVVLAVLVSALGAVSGAHFNPAVTFCLALRGGLRWSDAVPYTAVQIAGGLIGVWAAHLMFEVPVWQLSTTVRTGFGQWFAEAVATFGLLLTIFGCITVAPSAVAYAVGLYITAAYWFTASMMMPASGVMLPKSCGMPSPGKTSRGMTTLTSHAARMAPIS